MTWSSMATRSLTGPRRPFGGLGGFGSLAVSIPLGLSAGRPFSPLSRAISAHWAATVCSSAAPLPSSSITSAFSSVGESASRSPGGAILPGNQRSARQGSEKRAAATSFAAGTVCGVVSITRDGSRRGGSGRHRDQLCGEAIPAGDLGWFAEDEGADCPRGGGASQAGAGAACAALGRALRAHHGPHHVPGPAHQTLRPNAALT